MQLDYKDFPKENVSILSFFFKMITCPDEPDSCMQNMLWQWALLRTCCQENPWDFPITTLASDQFQGASAADDAREMCCAAEPNQSKLSSSRLYRKSGMNSFIDDQQFSMCFCGTLGILYSFIIFYCSFKQNHKNYNRDLNLVLWSSSIIFVLIKLQSINDSLSYTKVFPVPLTVESHHHVEELSSFQIDTFIQ